MEHQALLLPSHESASDCFSKSSKSNPIFYIFLSQDPFYEYRAM
jgi:hypothetical protein